MPANPIPAPVRRFDPTFTWEGVERLPYKEEGSAPFRAISRQVLFSMSGLESELRYFEITPGGHSTLEQHEHVHAVVILRGRGYSLVGHEVYPVAPHDLITIPSWTWHQLRPAGPEPLGFLCLVNLRRDRPHLPAPADIATLRTNPKVAAFLDGTLRETGNARDTPPV